MGFLNRLLGRDPESRVERARLAIEQRRFNDARWAVEGLSHPDAEDLRTEAMAGLVNLNIEEAQARFSAGDHDGGREHLELARQ